MMAVAHRQVIALMRHGEAVSTSEDAARPLSAIGRRHAEQMATWLESRGLSFDEIRSSDKLRARQTAEVVARRLGMAPGRVCQVRGMGPNDDAAAMAHELGVDERSAILVGHLPMLESVASVLLTGEPGRIAAQFDDASAMIVGRTSDGWHLLAFVGHAWL